MAQATTVRGSKLLVKLGDGTTPEQFIHNCTINNQRGIQLSANTNDTNVPDCDDPDLMAWVEREKVSLSASVTGEGTLNAPDVDIFWDWFTDADARNAKIVLDIPGASGGRIFTGAWHCTGFEVSGTRGEKVTCSITLQSSGIVVKTNNT